MIIEFSGPAIPSTPADLFSAARVIGCSVPVVKSVCAVETGGVGGFLTDGSGRPRILFEAQHFSAFTGGVYDAEHPDISDQVWNPKLYVGGAVEYDRLGRAVALNRLAALKATSWGLFQIMGSNCVEAGFSCVENYVLAMADGERQHLMAFARFVVNRSLAPALRARNWDDFARRYNGPFYRQNGYATKLQAAYSKIMLCPSPPILSMGDVGDDVRVLQRALAAALGRTVTVDGLFGPSTQIAVRQFQAASGLDADGIVGAATQSALGLPSTALGLPSSSGV